MAISRSQWIAANLLARKNKANSPSARSVKYDPSIGRIHVELDNGVVLTICPAHTKGLEGALPDDFADPEISPSGLGIHFPKIDADIYLPSLLRDLE
jgi:Protein of unknown function (DUF2442)